MRSAEHGFTLVELMVALLIFALLAAAGTAMLAFSVRAQGIMAAKLDDIGALNRLNSMMAADLGQAQARATRDENGGPVPAFTGGAGAGAAPMLQLVRLGWTNIDGAPRADAQKVEYRVSEGRLQRIVYPMLDGAAPLPPSTLIDNVGDIALRYRLDGAWSDRWASTPLAALPQALEMTLTRRDGRRYRALFLVGNDYRPMPGTAGAPHAR